jgi:hypothetical protein
MELTETFVFRRKMSLDLTGFPNAVFFVIPKRLGRALRRSALYSSAKNTCGRVLIPMEVLKNEWQEPSCSSIPQSGTATPIVSEAYLSANIGQSTAPMAIAAAINRPHYSASLSNAG